MWPTAYRVSRETSILRLTDEVDGRQPYDSWGYLAPGSVQDACAQSTRHPRCSALPTKKRQPSASDLEAYLVQILC